MSEAVPLPPRAPAAGQSEWIARHQGWLWRYLRFLGCAADAAEDVCQETFLAALHHGIERRPDARAAAWLRTTARNFFRRQLRTTRRRGQLIELDEQDQAFASIDVRPDDDEHYREALRQCLAALPLHARRVLDLRYRDERDRAGIAAELGLSEEGVKTRLRRFLQRLRDCVQRRISR